MIKAEQIPPESLGEMVRTLSDTGSYAKALAAAINAWPGMYMKAYTEWTEVRLPLTQENNNGAD